MHEIDRTRRVSEVIRRELATLIQREISDPRIINVSVNAVRVSKDLKNATVYVSTMDGNALPMPATNKKADSDEPGKTVAKKKKPEQPKTVEQLLNNASGFLRHLLSQATDLRVTPSLRFRYDDSIQRGVEMSSLIESLKKS